MKKAISLILPLCLVLVGCTPIEQSARDAAATLGGTLTYAQAKYTPTCTSNPSQTVCQAINRGVAGQNALITAIETYCSWSTNAPPPDPTTKCVPVKSAESALKSAIDNANRLVTEIRGAL